MANDLLKLGQRIKALRERDGLSQCKFALMVGMSSKYLSDIENGRRNVSYEKLVSLADGFGITLEELFRDF